MHKQPQNWPGVQYPLNGPYIRKWSNLSVTSQIWFCSAFVLQAIFAAENAKYYDEVLAKTCLFHVYFTVDIMNKTKNEKKNFLCQTHSWNKGGLKSFRFREYGPM